MIEFSIWFYFNRIFEVIKMYREIFIIIFNDRSICIFLAIDFDFYGSTSVLFLSSVHS